MKNFMFTLLSLVMIFTMVDVSYANEFYDGRKVDTQTIIKNIEGVGDVTFIRYDDQGAISYVVAGPDQQKIDLSHDDYMKIMHIMNDDFAHANKPEKAPNVLERYVSRSSQQWLNSALSTTWMETAIIQHTVKIGLRSQGTSTGYYLPSNGTPTHIILHTSICYEGHSMSISWPPSFSPANKCGTRSTLPFMNTNFAMSQYNNAYSEGVFLDAVTQTDVASVRHGNVDHNPSSTVLITKWTQP